MEFTLNMLTIMKMLHALVIYIEITYKETIVIIVSKSSIFLFGKEGPKMLTMNYRWKNLINNWKRNFFLFYTESKTKIIKQRKLTFKKNFQLLYIILEVVKL